jgi:hypothetical protein
MTKLQQLTKELESAKFLLNEANKNWDSLTVDEKLYFIEQERNSQRRYSLYTGEYVPETMALNN